MSSSYGTIQISTATGTAPAGASINGHYQQAQAGPGPSSLLTSPRLRRPSRASSVRTAMLVGRDERRPDSVTRLIHAQYARLPSSAALQETDLSVGPVLLDAPDEPPDTFRRQTLLSLDLLRGALLALHADENIQLFLRADKEPDENWYSRQAHWTESPLYALRLLANPAAPGLMLLGGIGVVLFQQSRLQLGWSRWKLLWHFTTRAGTLMAVNLLLTLDFTMREDGPKVVENLLLFSFGVNLLLLGCATVGLHTLERVILSRTLERHAAAADGSTDPFLDDDGSGEQTKAARAETLAYRLGNAMLFLLAAAFFAMNMLAVPTLGTRYQDRSDWFWFWIMPNPAMPDFDSPTYHRVLSQYSPLNWLPFGLLGMVYGRFLTRKARTHLALHSINLAIFLSLTTFFVLTRILKFGNSSSDLLPPASPRHPSNPYLASWQAFLYTTKFPPDLAYSSLALAANALLFVVLTALKTSWREALPFVQIGRAPIFFYAANLLVFRFVANVALAFFGLPSRLEFGPALCCYAGTLVITWFLCRAYVAFKDARSSPDSFWRFL